MQQKVWLACLKGNEHSDFGTFPFFQGYRYALPENTRKKFHGFLHYFKDNFDNDYYVRLPISQDQRKIAEVLESYGESTKNYENLEICKPEILGQIASNIVTAQSHGYYVCFVICDQSQDKVIGFLQLDLYDITTLSINLEQFFLPAINKWMAPSAHLTLNQIQNSSLEVLQKNLGTIDSKQALQEHKTQFGAEGLAEILLGQRQYILEAFKSYKKFYREAHTTNVVSNLSYALLPDYHHRGIMTQVIKSAISYLKKKPKLNIFKWLVGDRIACANTPSINLLKKLGFEVTATFDAYYTDNYKTRRHPNGNFTESCQALVFTLA